MYTKYYVITNGGDGSASVEWFDEKPDMDALENDDPETYGMNEGYVGSVTSESPINV